MKWNKPSVNGETMGLARVGGTFGVVDGRERGGAKVLLFGGMASDGTMLNDLAILVVSSLAMGRFSYTWNQASVSGAPPKPN